MWLRLCTNSLNRPKFALLQICDTRSYFAISGVIGVRDIRREGKTESNNQASRYRVHISRIEKNDRIGDCRRRSTHAVPRRVCSKATVYATITCTTSSPLFHCKLLAEPRAALYSYHNEKVVPIRDVETHEWLRPCAIATRVWLGVHRAQAVNLERMEENRRGNRKLNLQFNTWSAIAARGIA